MSQGAAPTRYYRADRHPIQKDGRQAAEPGNFRRVGRPLLDVSQRRGIDTRRSVQVRPILCMARFGPNLSPRRSTAQWDVLLLEKRRGSKGIWGTVQSGASLRVTQGKGKHLRIQFRSSVDVPPHLAEVRKPNGSKSR